MSLVWGWASLLSQAAAGVCRVTLKRSQCVLERWALHSFGRHGFEVGEEASAAGPCTLHGAGCRQEVSAGPASYLRVGWFLPHDREEPGEQMHVGPRSVHMSSVIISNRVQATSSLAPFLVGFLATACYSVSE